MQLSIIIVNYNVRYFLEQCLCSVEKALQNIIAEVWVVDNASKDGSVEYLQEQFPFVKFIINKTNVGFAKANNQALKQCLGDYVLFLNPDTIVPEDALEKTLAFIHPNSKVGAVGVRMIDGCGTFLPESKRSFPSPLTSFYKLAGLTSLFPKSKMFAKYNLGYLNQHENHEVDVLSGAFFLARRDLLQQLNGFDDSFFMYGEDIDLSYRIQKAGYKNYYFAGTTIIHFKGESTKKGSLNYVRMFYNAMSIFVKKHYNGGAAKIFSLFIQIAIWMRASFTALLHFIIKLGLPLLDTVIIFGSFALVTNLWVRYVRGGDQFIEQLVNVALPGFTLLFLLTAAVAGIYDNRYKPMKAFLASSAAIVVMLATYSLLPEKFRFSRGVVLFGGLAAALFITMLRWLLVKWKIVDEETETDREGKTLVVGSIDEFKKVVTLLEQAGLTKRVLGRVSANGSKEDALGDIDELTALTETVPLKEVIFCEGHLTFSSIVNHVQQLPPGINARFHGKKSNSIVGSDSKDTSGESVSLEGPFKLASPYQRRMKRVTDVTFACFLLITFPIQLILRHGNIVRHAFVVLLGKKTWIGYSTPHSNLPSLPPGVLSAAGHNISSTIKSDIESAYKIDKLYAKEYDWRHDVKLLIKHCIRL